MGDFSAVFVRVDGLDEADCGMRHLKAETVEEACDEARSSIPSKANFIKILREGRVMCKIGVDL